MVKIQKHKAYTYETEDGNKIDHYKYTVNIPEDTINQLGWSSGMDLQPTVRRNTLILHPSVEMITEESKTSDAEKR